MISQPIARVLSATLLGLFGLLSLMVLVSCEEKQNPPQHQLKPPPKVEPKQKREQLTIKPHPIVSEERLALTREYNRIHYGIDSHVLKNPAIVVIHHTAIASLEGSFKAFQAARLPGHRKYIKNFGSVNVGVHFLVDKNGDIYSLLPMDIAGRHAIGLNHVALGIENVAKGPQELTEAQLLANAALVRYLKDRHPSLKYLVGHHEYTLKELPHYRLYKELDPKYRPTIKSDPGAAFMKKLRDLLRKKYRLEFQK